MNYQEVREQICDICYKMWQLGWVAANDGNVSVKLEENLFLATPTGISKSFITPEKLILVNKNGEIQEESNGLRPSSELKMHMRCYAERPDITSVIHAPPGATGFAVAHKPMDMYNMIEDVSVIGSVPLTPTERHLPMKYRKQLHHISKSTMSCSWKITEHWQWGRIWLPLSIAWSP